MYKQTDQTYFLEKNLQNKIYRQETILQNTQLVEHVKNGITYISPNFDHTHKITT